MYGAREVVAKALALECMRGAHRQQRRCYLYAFRHVDYVHFSNEWGWDGVAQMVGHGAFSGVHVWCAPPAAALGSAFRHVNYV